MKAQEICDKIYYVGVNDHETKLFENLWPLPCGVSYNSYVIADREIVLVDTCKEGYYEEYIDNIKAIIGEDRNVDYIVVNHMEPDHSSLIKNIIQDYPDVKIVANKIAKGMIKGFYGIDDDSRFLEIANGQTLTIGELTLKFVFTPMVHWPETMMTYVEERGVLFSGDAFGCFGSLREGLIDNEIRDLDLYYEEMYRYYSNIVGKYGAAVNKAMKALDGLDLKYICSTHGPIWHDHKDKVIKIYDQLANYRSDRGVCIVYGSMYGNTKAIAEKIASLLKDCGIAEVTTMEVTFDNLSFVISEAFRSKGLIIGSPTYSMTLFPPVDAFVKAMKVREIKNKVISVFGTYAWAPAATKELKTFCEDNKWNLASSIALAMSLHNANAEQLQAFVADFVKAYSEI